MILKYSEFVAHCENPVLDRFNFSKYLTVKNIYLDYQIKIKYFSIVNINYMD